MLLKNLVHLLLLGVGQADLLRHMGIVPPAAMISVMLPVLGLVLVLGLVRGLAVLGDRRRGGRGKAENRSKSNDERQAVLSSEKHLYSPVARVPPHSQTDHWDPSRKPYSCFPSPPVEPATRAPTRKPVRPPAAASRCRPRRAAGPARAPAFAGPRGPERTPNGSSAA